MYEDTRCESKATQSSCKQDYYKDPGKLCSYHRRMKQGQFGYPDWFNAWLENE